jgi:hypothetical protein
MPALQVVDTTPRKPEPTGVEQFFSKIAKSYKDQSDRDQIGEIINEYSSNRQEANAFENMQLKLEKSNISPSRRMEVQNSLNDIKKGIIQKDKALNAQFIASQKATEKKNEKAEKAERTKNEVKEIYLSANYSPEEAEAKSEIMSAQSAREEVGRKQEGDEYRKLREKSISEYVNEAMEAGEEAMGQEFAIEEAEKATQSGNVTGPGFMALLKNNPYTQLIVGLTPDEAALQATNKKLLEGTKGLFGPKPTEREFFLLLNEMLPSIGKSKEANQAGLAFIRKVNNLKSARSAIVSKLTNGGSKYVPNIQELVNKEMKPLHDALLSDLREAKEKYGTPESKDEKKESKDGIIKVRAPDGTYWDMTQAQIDKAAKDEVIFEPV